MPSKDAGDPHTLVFDSAGNIWFMVQHGNFIDKLMTKTREVKLVKILKPNARPYDIGVDSNDCPWVVLFGSYKLATVDPDTLFLEEYELPNKNSRSRLKRTPIYPAVTMSKLKK
jgi:virginiamycin B lyase